MRQGEGLLLTSTTATGPETTEKEGGGEARTTAVGVPIDKPNDTEGRAGAWTTKGGVATDTPTEPHATGGVAT